MRASTRGFHLALATLVWVDASWAAPAGGWTFTQGVSSLSACISRGDWSGAQEWMQALVSTFGEEAFFEEDKVQRKLLPLQAVIALAQGRGVEAADALERIGRRFPPSLAERPAHLHDLGYAQWMGGRLEAAVASWETLSRQFPESPEAVVARFRIADALAGAGQHSSALEGYLELARAGTTPNGVRRVALWEAVTLKLEHGQAQAALPLLQSSLGLSLPPEIRWPLLVACGDALIQTHPPQALEAYQAVGRRPPDPPAGAAHSPSTLNPNRVRQGLIRQLRDRVEHARRNSPIASPEFHQAVEARRAETYLLCGRPWEAAALSRYAASDGALDPDSRQQFHLRWVRSLIAAGLPALALEEANRFIKSHPGSERLAEALFLAARSWLEQSFPGLAAQALESLIAQFPTHPGQPLWNFTLGLAFARLGSYSEARLSLQRCCQHPGPLAPTAHLWIALTHQAQRDHLTARTVLEQWILETPPTHPLVPEAVFQIASTHYATNELNPAQRQLQRFIREYPDHLRTPQAKAMLGDVLMGLGELHRALAVFRSIRPDEGTAVFTHGVFQVAKILRAQGKLPDLADHFTTYLWPEPPPPDPRPPPRAAEALQAAVRALLHLDRPVEAVAVIDRSLNLWGHHPSAGDLGPVFSLRRRVAFGSDFPAWRTWLSQQADVSTHLPTLRARYLLLLAQCSPAPADSQIEGAFPERQEILQQLCGEGFPIDALDPGALLATARWLEESAAPESACLRYQTLIERFPTSSEAVSARFHLAQFRFQSGDVAGALADASSILSRFPLHPVTPQTGLLAAEAQFALGQDEAARRQLQEIMVWKHARGRPQALALLRLARWHEDRSQDDAANLLWHRVVSLHRAQTDLFREACLKLWEKGRARADRDALARQMLDYPELVGQAWHPELLQFQQANPAPAEPVPPPVAAGQARREPSDPAPPPP